MKLFAKDRPLTPSWDLLAPSYALVRENLWSVVYLSFLPTLFISVGLAMMGDHVHGLRDLHGPTLIGAYITAGASLWSLLTYPGYVHALVKGAQGEHSEPWQNFKKGLPHLYGVIIVGMLSFLAYFFGLLMFVAPGVIFIRGFYLARYYLIDQKLSPIAAMKASFRASKPVAGWIWGTIGVSLCFALSASIVGQIPVLGVLLSSLVSYPYAFATALRYAEIEKHLKPKIQVIDTND